MCHNFLQITQVKTDKRIIMFTKRYGAVYIESYEKNASRTNGF